MWEWKNSDGTLITFRPTASQKRCPICGQYFKKGEKACAIVPPMEIRKNYSKLAQNLAVHIEDWEKFCEGITNEIALAEKYERHKTPKKKELNDEEKSRIDAFKSACHYYGFYEDFDKPYGIKCKKPTTSMTIEYHVYMDQINFDYRGKKGMFDGFFAREIIAKVHNKMHEILGDGKKDNYSSAKAINEVVAETKKIMSEIM